MPDDVFDKEKGDVKPTKPKKKVPLGKKATNPTAPKRSFSEIDVCDSFDMFVAGIISRRPSLASHAGVIRGMRLDMIR